MAKFTVAAKEMAEAWKTAGLGKTLKSAGFTKKEIQAVKSNMRRVNYNDKDDIVRYATHINQLASGTYTGLGGMSGGLSAARNMGIFRGTKGFERLRSKYAIEGEPRLFTPPPPPAPVPTPAAPSPAAGTRSTPIQDVFTRARTVQKSRENIMNAYNKIQPKTAPTKNVQKPEPAATQNQVEAGAAKSSTIPSGQPAQNTSMFSAQVKALRSKGGKADIYAANRLEGEHNAFTEFINNGQHKEAAEMIGATGDFSNNIAGLRKQGDAFFTGQAEQGPGIQDYIFGHKIPSTAVGIAIAGGAIAAVNSNGGRRSNADLYSSPF